MNKVSFSTVHVRKYDIILGDHPESLSGPPLSLGWHYSEAFTADVNEFERLRIGERCQVLQDMFIPGNARHDMLRRCGFTFGEIQERSMDTQYHWQQISRQKRLGYKIGSKLRGVVRLLGRLQCRHRRRLDRENDLRWPTDTRAYQLLKLRALGLHSILKTEDKMYYSNYDSSTVDDEYSSADFDSTSGEDSSHTSENCEAEAESKSPTPSLCGNARDDSIPDDDDKVDDGSKVDNGDEKEDDGKGDDKSVFLLTNGWIRLTRLRSSS